MKVVSLALAFLLVAVAVSSVSASKFVVQSTISQLQQQAVQSVRSRLTLQQVSDNYRAVLHAKPANVPPACLQAYSALLLAQQTCPPTIFNSNGFDSFQNFTNADFDDYCQGPCVSGLEFALKSLVRFCTPAEIGDAGNSTDVNHVINLYLAILRLPCVKFQGQYCLPSFYNALSVLDDHDDQPDFTDAELGQVCTPCLPIIVKYVSEFGFGNGGGSDGGNGGSGGGSGGSGGGSGGSGISGIGSNDHEAGHGPVSVNGSSGESSGPGPFAFLSALCVRDRGQFCFPKFYNLTTSFENEEPEEDGPPPPALVTRICDRCIFRVTARLYALTGNPDFRSMLGNFTDLCSRDENNNLCWVRIHSDFQAVDTACDGLFDTGQCNNTCSAAITGLLTNGGCCAAMLVRSAAEDAGMTVTEFQTFLTTACSLTVGFPSACPKRSAIFAFILANLRYQYYLDHTAQVNQDIVTDVAGEAGVLPDDVQITNHAASGEGTSVTTTILAPSQQDASDVSVTLQAAQSSGTFTFASVSSLPAESRVNLLEPAGAVDGTSGVALTSPSTFLLALILLLAVFL